MHITNQLTKLEEGTIMKMRNNFVIFSLAANFLILNCFGVTSAQDVILQEGNALPKFQLSPRPSGELADNRIGTIFSNFEPQDGVYSCLDRITYLGLKRVELALHDIESPIDYSQDEFFIPPAFDDHINDALVQNSIIITYILNFWDTANHPQGWTGITSRFKTEEEILRYLDYVRFIVGHFKDRVQYFKIWNEPDNCGDPAQCVEVADMINLIRRTVPVIHEEYPEAKVVVGGNVYFFAQDYFFTVLNSDIMPLVDVVDWQTMPDFGPSDESWRDYFSTYPSLVQQFKDTASAHGFSGEYRASELWWWFPQHPTLTTLAYPESAYIFVKNSTRGMLTQLGLNVTVRAIGTNFEPQIINPAMTKFFTVMAGAAPDSLPVAIEKVPADTTDIAQYGFTFQNDSDMVILWRDVEPQPVGNDPGVPVTITLAGFAGRPATGVDVLHGFEQRLITSDEGGNLVIRGLLVKDYPIIVRFSSITTGVQSDVVENPTKYSLYQNFPNPFNPTTQISFDLPKQSQVTISIFNSAGQLVRRLVNSDYVAGSHNIVWNGRNDLGKPVASGLYLYTIRASGFVRTKKMVMLK